MSGSSDPYLLPNGILRNKLGITKQSVLTIQEAVRVAGREKLLLQDLPQPPFIYDTLKAIHGNLFQDVYDWAGQQRTTPLAKRDYDDPDSRAFRFAEPGAIKPRMDALFRRLAADANLTGRTRDGFAEGATALLAELNNLHFAREGNGRTQRLLVTAIAANAGHPVAFDIVTKERMTEVSIEAHGATTGGLRRMLDEALDPRQVAAMRKAIGFLGEAGKVKWNDLYIATTRAGETYQGVLVSRAGPDFMMRAERSGGLGILIGDARDLPAGAASGQALALRASRFGTPPSPDPATAVMRALSRPATDAPAPWDAALTPLAARLDAYRKRAAEAAAAPKQPLDPQNGTEADSTPKPRKPTRSDPGPGF